MTSERKIEANRRNAQRSTGPCSGAGKRRSSSNAWRHGLSAASRYVGYTEADVVSLVVEIAGADANVAVEAFAREAAHAQLRLNAISQYKVALINRARVFGTTECLPDPRLMSASELLVRVRAWEATGLFLKPPDPEATMPQDEPDRTQEAIKRALPRLIKVDRYERRAISARDSAIKGITHAITMTIKERMS